MTTVLIILCIVLCIGVVLAIVTHFGVAIVRDKSWRTHIHRHHAARRGWITRRRGQGKAET